ncbi:MAG: NAD kinase [Bacteroidia bacterium]|nr:NAD kinase [Bacteroidia bacterium]MDW8300945.1 NAD kinase [Bacteroidia bacterium]
MRIALIGIKAKAELKNFYADLYKTFNQNGIQTLTYYLLRQELHKLGVHPEKDYAFRTAQEWDKVDMVISLGGDGTVLEAARIVGSLEVPILGINLGRLGFLATTTTDKLNDMINLLQNKKYKMSARSLLQLQSNKSIFVGYSFALNDFSLHKTNNSSMITVHTWLNGNPLNSYWADGLVVSTPTGATGYSLSCGGPIITPDSNCFVITPVAPHSLTARPLVIADHHEIKCTFESRSQTALASLDSRSELISSDCEIYLKKAPFKVFLVYLGDNDFFGVLRNKLFWGLDKRN